MMRLRRVFVGGLAFLGGIVLLLVLIGLGLGIYYQRAASRAVPQKTILELDFEKGLTEYLPDQAFIGLAADSTPTVLDTVQALERAAKDPRILAVVARVGGADMGLATIQEMRNAVFIFRESGKPAIAFAETFGEFGPGNAAYYLATAFDDIYLQPSGDLGLTGLIYRVPFVRGTLDKLGIKPSLDHRGKYKTAMNTFTEMDFTEAQKESTLSVMHSNFDQITKGVAQARGISEREVRGLINEGPFSSEEAVRKGLVDGLAYRDEVCQFVKDGTDPEAEFLSVQKYGDSTEDDTSGDAPPITVALIYGVGPVHRGESTYSPFDTSPSMGSDTIAKAFRDAVEDKDVRAILFRVNSPGGSYIASDTIWREMVQARDTGKPIIVSMGDVAASGGYFVSVAANEIVAQPATLTGSIGVFAGKPVTADFWAKLGISWGEVHTGDHATMWTTLRDYSPEEWDIFQRWLDRVYNDFTGKVSQGRNLPVTKVDEVAQGRVWTGEEARAHGLVDSLGGFPEALRAVREVAGVPADTPVRLKEYPERKSFLESVAGMFLGKDDDLGTGEVAAAVTRTKNVILPFVYLARELGFIRDHGPLSMPEMDVLREK